MRKFLYFFALIILISGCKSSTVLVGSINMISTRNINSTVQYTCLKTHVGTTKQEIKHAKGSTIEEAIDNRVRMVAGGEYMMNVKIYVINGKYYSVSGDIWGIASNDFKGFRIGDRVIVKEFNSIYYATISSIKDDEKLIVKLDNGVLAEVKFDNITITTESAVQQPTVQQPTNQQPTNQQPSYNFKIGDKVSYEHMYNTVTGTITKFKNANVAYIKRDSDNKIIAIPLKSLHKIQ